MIEAYDFRDMIAYKEDVMDSALFGIAVFTGPLLLRALELVTLVVWFTL
jgi:hypothetical protein